MSAPVKWLFVVLVAALPVGLVVSGVFEQQASVAEPPPGTRDVIQVAKEIVKKRLRSPETAVFPPADQIRVETLAENRWRVSGYADAQTGVRLKSGVFGTARYPFSMTIEKNGSRWSVIDRDPEFNELTEEMREKSWTTGLPGTE